MESRLDFQCLLLPLLEIVREGDHSPAHLHAELMRYIELSDEAFRSRLPGGTVQAFVQEAAVQCREHLTKAGLIAETCEGAVRITSLGTMILSRRLNSLDEAYLRRLPGYR